MGTPRDILLTWVSAFNAHDVDALMECYHPDAVNYQVALEAPSVGVKPIRRGFEELFRAFPDIWTETNRLMDEGDWAVWEWKGGGTFQGEFMGVPPNERKYTLEGCGFFKFRDGKIEIQRGYWDKESWYSQLGLDL